MFHRPSARWQQLTGAFRSWMSYRRLCARQAYLRGSLTAAATYPVWDAVNARVNRSR